MRREDPWNAVLTWIDEPEIPPADGPLAGRPIVVKDLVDTAGVRTTYGSKVYADHVPTRDAEIVRRIKAAGAVIVGKSHLPEFAWNVLGDNPFYGMCHNPTRPGKTTGGSSSGSAAAIAGGIADLAIGSDTGCSIRLPSAACDTVGLKSRWGVIPMEGVFPLVPTIDTVGPMARTVADVALLWSVMAGRPVPEPRLDGMKVGVLREAPNLADGRTTESSDAAEQWVGDLESLGASVVESSVPDASSNPWPMFLHEAARSHEGTYPSRRDEYGEVMQAKLDSTMNVTSDQVEAAYRAVEEWRAYEPEVDLYVSPCYAVELPPEDADELEVRLPLTSFLRWVNLFGWAGLAVGNMQLIAPHDETVLAAGLAFERGA